MDHFNSSGRHSGQGYRSMVIDQTLLSIVVKQKRHKGNRGPCCFVAFVFKMRKSQGAKVSCKGMNSTVDRSGIRYEFIL